MTEKEKFLASEYSYFSIQHTFYFQSELKKFPIGKNCKILILFLLDDVSRTFDCIKIAWFSFMIQGLEDIYYLGA